MTDQPRYFTIFDFLSESLFLLSVTTGCYLGWQVGETLGEFLNRARGEVSVFVDKIRKAAAEISTDERLRRRQRTIALVLKTFSWAVAGIAAALGTAALYRCRSEKPSGRAGSAC